jgi:hypothetical protein
VSRPVAQLAAVVGARRRLLVVVLLLAALVAGLWTTTPTSGAFTAAVRGTANTATTAASFPRTSGALPYRSGFAGGASDWTTYDGCWSTTTAEGFGMYAEKCGSPTAAAPKAVTGSASWTDYTIQADVKLDGGKQVGLLARVSDPSPGLDQHNGYWAYISSAGKLELGRMTKGSYTFLRTIDVPGGISVNTWYHLVVQVTGCTITVSQSTAGANGDTGVRGFTYEDTACAPVHRQGMVGLRDFEGTGAWRFVTVTAGATAATDPQPWNTPWKTGNVSAFTPYGGAWRTDQAAETYSNTQSGKGDKSIETTRTWGNSSLTGEVRFDAASGADLDAGFDVRVRNPGVGTDELDGYYGGISRTSLILGEHVGGTWREFVRTPLPAAVPQGQWQHLTVEMVGCTITVTVQASSGGPQTKASSTDTGCDTTPGNVGVRTLGIPASFRSMAVTPR